MISQLLLAQAIKFSVFAVAGTRHNANWTTEVGSDVEGIVYQQDDEGKPHYYSRDGNEVGAYLQFILDYYECLPNVSPSSTRRLCTSWFHQVFDPAETWYEEK